MIVVFVALVRAERKNCFFIELYDLFEQKYSFRVATVFFKLRE